MKKKLLIVIQHFYRGGAERSAAKLSALLKNQFDIHVIFFVDPEQLPMSFQPEGKITCLGEKVTKNPFNKLINLVKRTWFLRQYKKEHKIDFSLSFLFNADIVNVLSKQSDKVLLSIRTFLSKNEAHLPNPFIARRIYKKADFVVTQNERMRQDTQGLYNLKSQQIGVIPNSFDIDQIIKARDESIPEWPNASDFIKFINLGRFSHPKGHRHLLRIFKSVLSSYPKARLILIGEGELKSMILDFAKTLELTCQDLSKEKNQTPDFDKHHIIMLGFQENPFPYLHASDAFLFTSLFEGFPNALAEAMICSSLVFSSDCMTGPKELIAPDVDELDGYPVKSPNGVLLPAFSGEIIDALRPLLSTEVKWVESILDFIKNKEAYSAMGKNAHKRMQAFSYDRVLTQWIDLFELIDGRISSG